MSDTQWIQPKGEIREFESVESAKVMFPMSYVYEMENGDAIEHFFEFIDSCDPCRLREKTEDLGDRCEMEGLSYEDRKVKIRGELKYVFAVYSSR